MRARDHDLRYPSYGARAKNASSTIAGPRAIGRDRQPGTLIAGSASSGDACKRNAGGSAPMLIPTTKGTAVAIPEMAEKWQFPAKTDVNAQHVCAKTQAYLNAATPVQAVYASSP